MILLNIPQDTAKEMVGCLLVVIAMIAIIAGATAVQKEKEKFKQH